MIRVSRVRLRAMVSATVRFRLVLTANSTNKNLPDCTRHRRQGPMHKVTRQEKNGLDMARIR